MSATEGGASDPTAPQPPPPSGEPPATRPYSVGPPAAEPVPTWQEPSSTARGAIVPYPHPASPGVPPGLPAPTGHPPAPTAHPVPYRAYPPPVVVGRKEPALAGVLSWLLPGVGQLYNGRVGPGVGFLVAYLLNLPFVILLGIFVVPVLVSLAIVVWSVIDAVLGAQQRNRELAARLAQQGMRPPVW